MASTSTAVPVLLLLVVAAVYLYRRYICVGHQLPLPPGPKGVPLLGNINDLPPAGVIESYHWAKHKAIYGNDTVGSSGKH